MKLRLGPTRIAHAADRIGLSRFRLALVVVCLWALGLAELTAQVAPPLVAVLPFQNLSADPSDDWVGVGIAETVIADLQRSGGMFLIGSERVAQELGPPDAALPPGPARGPAEVGRRLGVGWVVTGTFQRVDDQVRITASVVDVETDTITRTAKLDGNAGELFALQDRVVPELGLTAPSPTFGGAPVRTLPSPEPGASVISTPSSRVEEAPAPEAVPSRAAPAIVPGIVNGVPWSPDKPDEEREPGDQGVDLDLGTEPPKVADAGGVGAVPARRGGPLRVAGLELPFGFDGPAVPELPEVVTRDDRGRATLRAIRVTRPIVIDGRLDEALYTMVTPISDFIQQEPTEGAPATERTEMWLAFDQDNVYISFRLHESQPERVVANEMRRDSTRIYQGNDNVAVMLDTFYDRRNSLLFEVNPLGGRIDGQVANERQFSLDWNPIWDVSTGQFDGGWTVEMAIPFKSIRYQPGQSQIWGFNARRANRWKNESSLLTRIPASLGPRALFQASLAATLVGIEAPPRAQNLEIKPYVIGDLSSDVSAGRSNTLGRDVGVDVRYGVTQGLTANFTYNTDFAQVEADEQQVNLTRFSLFFPEKREFFLENQGLFSFGGAGGGSFGGGGDAPILFYSRRIGLDGGVEVPLQAGGRLTGRIGRYSLGLLNIQGDESPLLGTPATNFSVLRLKRDILRRSNVGLIYTGRSVSQVGTSRNDVFGIDGTFGFYDNISMNTYWAQSETTGLPTGDATSYRAQFDYAGDRYGASVEHLYVGDAFNPEIGFVRRDDMRQTSAAFRFSPRPRNAEIVRKYSYDVSADYVENGAGVVETRQYTGGFGIEFQNSDQLSAGFSRSYEFLPIPFPIATGVVLPVGGYDFSAGQVQMTFGQQRPVSGRLTFAYGSFYNGHRTTLAVQQGRVSLSDRLNVEPTYSMDRVDLAQGAFTSHLFGARLTNTMTPLMFTSALIQYNSSTRAISTNLRMRWEYSPGSELFVVYNEQRDTVGLGFPGLLNRALIVKANRLFRF